MKDLLKNFQLRHQEMLDQLKREEVGQSLLEEVSVLIADLREAGATVADPAGRGQLRAMLHFWGNVMYDHTGVYPETTLQPPDPSRVLPKEEPPPQKIPLFAWALIGLALVAVIAAVLLGNQIVWPRPQSPTPTASPSPTALPPIFAQSVVGKDLTEEGTLALTTDVFCKGVTEIIAEFTLESVQPDTMWRWEILREGEVVASKPATPWGQHQDHITVSVLSGDENGIEPGQYELLIYANGQVVSTKTFRVMSTAPSVFNLEVTDVPDPTRAVTSPHSFQPGLRVVYLTYDFEGFCPDLEVSHELYQEAELLQESTEIWQHSAQGKKQVGFQASGNQPFPPGEYEIAISIGGEEAGRIAFTIDKPQSDVKAESAFGDIAIALGVQPDGKPILTTSDNRFDWNTKLVYAVFEYKGMYEGLRWSAVWTRNKDEVARQSGLWDVDDSGTEGVRWVVYYDDNGQTLRGGDYQVTLYIEDTAQSSAEFNIRYYR